MHPNARKQLVYLLSNALSDCAVERGAPNTWTESFSSVRALVTKLRGEWLSESDVNGIIAERVAAELGPDAGKVSGQLSKALKPDAISTICERVATFIESVPRKYRVMFPLPNLDLARDVVLTDSVSFVRTPEAEPAKGLRGLLGKQAPTPNRTYISVAATGYVNWSIRQSAMKDAASLMKRVMEVGVAKSLLIEDYRLSRGATLAALFGTPSANILQAVANDLSDTSIPAAFIWLPLGTSTLLQKLIVYDDSSLSALRKPRIDPSRKEDDLAKFLKGPTELVTDSALAEQTESLRSALEWIFDAHADDDDTAAFIKTCIALEAALGEESESDQITDRLADRCAFLLGRVASERSTTRKLIKDVYRLRSKLVHGKKTKLTPPDMDLVTDAELHLILVLQKEIEALERWSAR